MVTTGLALVPTLESDGQRLNGAAAVIATTFEAQCAERADPWIKVLVLGVPARVHAFNDNNSAVTLRDSPEDELAHKIALAFNATPVKVYWAASDELYPEVRCALAAFRSADLNHPPSDV
jgi:hypothetical protein